MGFKDLFSKLRRKKRQAKSFDAIESDKSDLDRIGSEEIPLKLAQKSPSVEVEKDSLQLGIAAGYTGRSLKSIESSLGRIESQMPSRDWLISYFNGQSPKLLELFKKHEENAQKRFEAIQGNLNSLQTLAGTAPAPVKSEMLKQISSIESQLPLTSRMKEVLQVVKESKEISYSDLASRLDISISALRGLLSNTIKRSKLIERFDKRRRGWVRYIGNQIDLNRYESLESDNNFAEYTLRDQFEALAEKEGFTILRRMINTSPDFIIKKDDRVIGVELKMIANTSSLEKAVGQLIFAKKHYKLQDTWLIFPSQTKPFSSQWLNIFKSSDIKVFILENEKLFEINATNQ